MRHKSQTKRYQPNVFTLSLVWGWSCCCFAVDEGLYRNINTYITRVTIWTTILECQNEISSPTKSMTAHTRTGVTKTGTDVCYPCLDMCTRSLIYSQRHTHTHTLARSQGNTHSLAHSHKHSFTHAHVTQKQRQFLKKLASLGRCIILQMKIRI